MTTSESMYRNSTAKVVQSRYEIIALLGHLKSRESNSRFQNKYVMATFKKNIIDKDTSLEDSRFKVLNNHLVEKGYIKKVKSCFILTESGVLR